MGRSSKLAKAENEAGEKSRAAPDKLSDHVPSTAGLSTPAAGRDRAYQVDRRGAELGAFGVRTRTSIEGLRGGHEGH